MLLGMLAAVWHAFLMTAATNDNFLHLTLAKQWLAGDWPVRDFFDQGSILQYGISAVAQALGGERLMSEAVVVAVAWAVTTYLVFKLVRQLTGSRVVAVLAALLMITSSARGYSYPKGIIYAVAGTLWWRYLCAPTARSIAIFGVWAALAFYWRADHGIYVALASALACYGAHGVGTLSLSRGAVAAATMLALMAPFLGYVHATIGLPEYMQTGVAAAATEHVTQGPHEWPLLRFGRNVIVVEPADRYAPTIAIRWSPESSLEQRRQVLERYGLMPVESDEGVDRVRLSSVSISDLRRVINEPIVADTAGIERSTATLLPDSWPARQRWRFNHALLRLRFLPSLAEQDRASEVVVALFYALPIAVIATAPWLSRYLAPVATARALIGFAVFALVVDAAMLRLPFQARAPDAVVLSAVLFGLCVSGLWRAGIGSRWLGRACLVAGATALTLLLTINVAWAGRFGERVNGLAGEGRSLPRALGAWSAAYHELVSMPPLAYFVGKRARFSLRLAAYVRDCVPENERLLVLWFEPEIYYYGDRLMAQRHLVFAPAWANVAHEQRMTLDRIKRFAPPIVMARRSALAGYASASYPGVVDYVEREYQLTSTIAEDGEEYLIFAGRGRPVLRLFEPEKWPCFVSTPSRWARVGIPTN
jgi:hypothetical protein